MTEVIQKKDLTNLLRLDPETRGRYGTCLETLGFLPEKQAPGRRDLSRPYFRRQMSEEEALHQFLFLSREVLAPYGITLRDWRKILAGRPVTKRQRQVTVQGQYLPFLETRDAWDFRQTSGYWPEIRFNPRQNGDLGTRVTLLEGGNERDSVTALMSDLMVTAYALNNAAIPVMPVSRNDKYFSRGLRTPLDQVPRLLEVAQEYGQREEIIELAEARCYLSQVEEGLKNERQSLQDKAHRIGCQAVYKFLEPRYRRQVKQFVRRKPRRLQVAVTIHL